jgi:hypothetical protein
MIRIAISVETVSAALGKDVRGRPERHLTDDRSKWERSRHSTESRQKAIVTMRSRRIGKWTAQAMAG